MRRFLFGVVIASVTAAMPSWAFGGDREIAEGIMTQLQQAKSQGMLKGFDLDLKVESGVVYLTGNVRSAAQHSLVVEAVERTTGVAQLVDHLHVTGETTKPVDVKRAEAKTETKSKERGESRSNFFLGNAVKRGPLETQAVVPASADETALQLGNDDVTITDHIIDKLQQHKQAGSLKGFDLDVTTADGEVSVRGKVASAEQKALVLDIARRVRGVRKVIDDVIVGSPIQQVSNIETSLPALQPVPQAPSMPVVGSSMPMVHPGMPAVGSGVAMGGGVPMGNEMYPAGGSPVVGNGVSPRPFAPAMVANMQNVQTGPGCYAGGPVAGGNMGGPVPMQAGGVAYGMGAPRYDQPYMPSYAWPSYAAYPNYAAVTYPKQYSPSAWPYIGPFYPYPQVPLGWRKVALEWDDGLWYLDFTSK